MTDFFAARSVTSWPEGASNDERRVVLGEAYERAATRRNHFMQRVSTAVRRMREGQGNLERTTSGDFSISFRPRGNG